jgi:hypothetical protein
MHEAYLEIIGNQIALGINRMADDVEEPAQPRLPIAKPEPADEVDGPVEMVER